MISNCLNCTNTAHSFYKYNSQKHRSGPASNGNIPPKTKWAYNPAVLAFKANLYEKNKLRQTQPSQIQESFLQLVGLGEGNHDKIRELSNYKIDLLASYFRELNTEHRQLFTSMLSASLNDRYNDFLFDETTPVGKANNATREEFNEAGLKFNQWMNYSGSVDYEDKKKQYKVSLWKRKPLQDLFIGNNARTCISTNRENPDVILGGLLNTKVQYVVVRDKKNNKITNYYRLYFVEKDRQKPPGIFLDYQTNNVSNTDPIKKFLAEYSKAVSPESSSIYSRYNYFHSNIQPQKYKLEIIGEVVPATRTSTYCSTESDFIKNPGSFYSIDI